MKRKLFVVFAALLLTVAASLSYLASITIPVQLKTLVVAEIESATRKKALVQSVRFDFVRGVTLQDLVIYDKSSILVWAKDVSCGIPLAPLLARKVVVSSLRIQSPAIYAERRADNSFNIVGLIPEDYSPGKDLALLPSRITIRNGRVLFVDRTLARPFVERIDDIAMDLRLALPAKIAYSLSCTVPSKQPAYFKSSGTYSVREKSFAALVTAKGVCLDEFRDYYKKSGFAFPSGTVDASMNIRAQGDTVDADIDAATKKLSVIKDNVKTWLDAVVKAAVQYNLPDKTLEYAGSLDIKSMDISGLEGVGPLKGLKATVEFDDARIRSENILVEVFGLPWKAKINIVNFASPLCDVYAVSETRLSLVQKMLSDRFGLKLPVAISGRADVNIALKMQQGKPAAMNGYVTLRDDTISLGSGSFPIEHVSGEVRFAPDKLTWSGAAFRYRDKAYTASGQLTAFASPAIALKVASPDLRFSTKLTVDGQALKISELNGTYLNSSFALAGEFDFSDPKIADADLAGKIDLELKDLKRIAPTSGGIAKMKPAGKLSVDITVRGDLKDPKACDITATAKSGSLSLYGLSFSAATASYGQSDGTGHLKSMHAALYGGTMSATGKIEWMAKALPYAVVFDARDVKLERLKACTGFKDKDVSGNVRLHLSLNGLFKDASKLGGLGHIAITNGKLWQLNLFRGFGSLIFTSDFQDIMFTEGSCDFKIRDRVIYAEYLVMKSDEVNLYGSGTIGFDKSLNGTLRTELAEGAMYPGTQKNIAAAVNRNTYAEVTGTLADPKFKMKTSVPDIVAGVAGAFFQQSQ